MEFKEENDAWICLNTKCLAYLPRGYGIGPIKGEQEELVTITDPYGDLQKPFAKRININRGTIWTENQLKRPVTEKHKIVSHPNKPAAAEESDR
jgi:hypothetical protein